MLKAFLQSYWPFLVFFTIIAAASWPIHKHNRDAARKGENPVNFNLSHRRNAFLKEPQPYTDDRKINRNWEP